MRDRLRRLAFILMGGASLLPAPAAWASYPDRTVTIMVGFAPGGGPDVVARIIGQRLSEKWGQSVVVDNRPGADGTIAEDVVAHSPPDGYTLEIATISHALTPDEYKLNYDPIKSFAPITIISKGPAFVLVPASFGASSLKDLIALARAEPGKLNYGTSGPYSSSALVALLLEKRTGINMVGVAYKGGDTVMTALVGGEINIAFFPIVGGAMGLVNAGKIKALAVTSLTRFPGMPDVPTVADAADLPKFEMNNWFGLLAPAGTPKDIVRRVHDDVAQIVKLPDFQKALAAQAMVPVADTPEDFTSFLHSELATWVPLMKQAAPK